MNIIFHFCQVCSARCLYEFHAAHLNPRWIRMTPIMDVSPVFPRLVQLVGLNGWKMLRAVVISKSATFNPNWAFFSNDAKKITVTKNSKIWRSYQLIHVLPLWLHATSNASSKFGATEFVLFHWICFFLAIKFMSTPSATIRS